MWNYKNIQRRVINILFISLMILTNSCNKSNNNTELSETSDKLLKATNYSIDSIINITPLTEETLTKLHLKQFYFSEEGVNMVQKIVETSDYTELKEIQSDYKLEDIIIKNEDSEKNTNINELYLLELKDNNTFQNYLYSIASKTILTKSKEIIDEEFGVFRQFHHLWNVLLVRFYIKEDDDITKEWMQIIETKLALDDLNSKINNGIRNYQSLLIKKHKFIDSNAFDFKELPKAKIDIKKLGIAIEPYIQEKLSNEGYDIAIDIFFTFLIVFITSLIFNPIMKERIIEANNWGEIRENLLKTGDLYLQYKSKSNERSSWVDALFNVAFHCNNAWTEHKISQAREKFEAKKRKWRTIFGSIVTIASLIYFIPKDIKIEHQIQSELNDLLIKNIDVKNIDVKNTLDSYTTFFYKK